MGLVLLIFSYFIVALVMFFAVTFLLVAYLALQFSLHEIILGAYK